MRIGSHQKLLFIGDSITDAGRNKPAPAEGLFDPMGRGYVTLVDALLGTIYPEHAIRVVNAGTSGNTVRDLKARWQTDVIDLKPDWLSVCIGINDVWRQFDTPRQTEYSVPLDEYETTYRAILAQVRPQLKGLVLITPYYIESNRADAMRARMDQYGAVVKKLAGEFDAALVDTQAAFDAALEHNHSAGLAWDRIHPNQTGHMILAKGFLDAVGFEWKR
jgi:lysophospholipase L1-like esterase